MGVLVAAETTAAAAAAAGGDSAGGSAGGASNAPKFVEKEDPSLKGKTPEQLAKIEAKRKAKEAKAAAKKAKKNSKKEGAASGFKLGAGTSKVFDALKAATASSTDFASLFDCKNLFHVELTQLLGQLASGGAKRKPNIVKGARDFHPEQVSR
jgi:hypothetical protein